MNRPLNEHGLPQRRRERVEDNDLDIAQAAQQEQARRVLARRRLLPFIIRNDPDFMVAWFHRRITNALETFSEAVANQESPRIIIQMPPRAGKSEMVSRNFPAWHLGRYPDHEVIACSYGSDLARDFSRKVRGQLKDDGYHAVFPDVDLDPGSQSVDRWNIGGHAGGYVAAGVGGPITGRGMHVGIIDDYVKNWEEADSKQSREKLWNWYSSTFKSRMAPGGGIIIMATRWNSDDLIGRVLEEEGDVKDGGRWLVIKLSAEAQEDEYDEDGTLLRRKGEPLHPERYDNEYYSQFKANARIWSALYQQEPITEGGNFFVKENFKTYRTVERPPLDEMIIVSTWDFAVGQNEQNDFTVGAVGGIDRNFKVWALEQVRAQWDSADTVDQIIDVYRTWKPDIWGFEHGQISLAIGPFLNRRLVEEAIWDLDIEEAAMKTGRKDKVLRAGPLRGFIRTGHFLWPEESDWFKPGLEEEFVPFPRGTHDDRVDAWAWMAQKAEEYITKGVVPVPTRRVDKYHVKPWRDRLAEIAAGQRQTDSDWRTS